MGAIVYVIFGSCKDITIGPTALMALMTHDYVQGRNADFAILLAFLSGCLQLLMACLRLGTCCFKIKWKTTLRLTDHGLSHEKTFVFFFFFRCTYRLYLDTGYRGIHIGNVRYNRCLATQGSVGSENLVARIFGHRDQSVSKYRRHEFVGRRDELFLHRGSTLVQGKKTFT